jgi:hypothetical protein
MEMIMSHQGDSYGLLREQAAVLSTDIKSMSTQLGEVSKALSSLRDYGQRSRTMIFVIIASLVLDTSLTVGLAIVTNDAIEKNHRINASIASIDCLTNGILENLNQRSDVNRTVVTMFDRELSALAKSVSAQVNARSEAERHWAQAQYLADIAKIKKNGMPSYPPFRPRC